MGEERRAREGEGGENQPKQNPLKLEVSERNFPSFFFLFHYSCDILVCFVFPTQHIQAEFPYLDKGVNGRGKSNSFNTYCEQSLSAGTPAAQPPT